MGSQRVRHDWVTELNWTGSGWQQEISKNYLLPSPIFCPSFSIKWAWILSWVRWFCGILVYHVLHLLVFLIKSLLNTSCVSVYCPVMQWSRTNKGPNSQSYGFPSSHVQIWKLDHKEGWALKNEWFWTVVLKTLESPLDSMEIKIVNPKGNQPWMFIGRTDAEAPILWPPDAKSRLIRKDPDAGKGWKQGKGATEDEMAGWRNWLNGHELEQILGDSKGQGSLACYWAAEQQQRWPK